MLIEPQEINKLLAISGDAVTKRGKKYFEQDKVSILNVEYKDDKNYNIITKVYGTKIYNVNILKSNGKIKYSCNCPHFKEVLISPCAHVIATLFDMYINFERYTSFKNSDNIFDNTQNDVLEENGVEVEKNTFAKKNNIINYFEKIEIKKSKSKVEVPKISLNPTIEFFGLKNDTISVSFKVGRKRMYILKDIYQFSESFLEGVTRKYGKELEITHNLKEFNEESEPLVDFLCSKANEYIAFSKLSENFNIDKFYKDKIILKYGALDEFFDLLNNKNIDIKNYKYSPTIYFTTEDPNFEFEVVEKEDNLILKNVSKGDFFIYRGQKYNYVLYKDKFFRCSDEFSAKVIPVLKEYIKNDTDEIVISNKQATSFCEYLLPNIKDFVNIDINSKIIEKYKADSLLTKVYLDINDSGDIIANVKFCYKNMEFNPFDRVEVKRISNVNRNKLQERKAKEILDKNNFKIDSDTSMLYLSKDEDIYNFMETGINSLIEKFEVLVTDRLKARNIINPKVVSMGLKIENDLLNIELDDLGFKEDELLDIIKSYRLKKKFYRLKDGSFVNIESSWIESLVNITDNTYVNEKDIIKGKITLPKYRAVYLDGIVNASENINAKKDATFKEVVRNVMYAKDLDFSMSKNMQNTLREYQKTGYNWLRTLDSLGFGGILADDMGLGKTIQVIALFENVKENENETSIVVCPSSLYINWEKEINKFAPDLKVSAIYGNTKRRETLIKNVLKYDVVITSYDLLKRDIEKYKEYNFRYIIADEAQYIKNNNTKNAKALKKLKGKTRFALTGTPMENSLSELWSIFDFCMPGYLFSYTKFKESIESRIIKFEDKDTVEKLNRLVAPFILRRTKKEVLKELPEKTETKMYNIMDEEQEKVYKAYLARAKKEIRLEIEENGIENSKIKILSLITRLRQVCCHPSLFLDNYEGESAKLNQCMQLIEDACNSSHKILVFSQFTSMLDIIKKELDKRKIKYYELTGKTKSDIRVELVDKFNKEDEVSVFLVSLKAGGTGLNLIGADVVIHFDPWWNLSVQNQATDRAYRIGQKSNVQVFSLITENTIEEKIAKLQDKKQNLADSIVKPGETFISKMSKEEIMELFE